MQAQGTTSRVGRSAAEAIVGDIVTNTKNPHRSPHWTIVRIGEHGVIAKSNHTRMEAAKPKSWLDRMTIIKEAS